jgi:hypothetical protein
MSNLLRDLRLEQRHYIGADMSRSDRVRRIADHIEKLESALAFYADPACAEVRNSDAVEYNKGGASQTGGKKAREVLKALDDKS